MTKKILVVMLLLAAAAGGWWFFSGNTESVVTTATSSASSEISQPLPANDTSGVGALGRIEPRSRVVHVSHDAGPDGARVEILHVAEGQEVKAGDLIVTFSDHGRKRAALETAKAGIGVIEGRLNAQIAEERTARREFERYRKLALTNAASVARKDEAQNRAEQASANIAALRAELEAEKSRVVLAEEEVKQTTVTAPISGTILKIHSWPGERVGDAGVVEMANLAALDVVAEVYERDIARVKPGQKAEITIRGLGRTITGTVRELGFQVYKNDLNNTDPLANRDNRIIEVRITVPQEDAAMLRNMIYLQVDVRIYP
ncbi:MAG: HlyD family efflux transporter periplasmic adaptor subunit [Alphaproteobacteria bacterium]